MLASVFGFKVALGLPATVTSPGLTRCAKCRCDPLVRLSLHPSTSSNLITSSTFVGMA
jgi:hypothetical protein